MFLYIHFAAGLINALEWPRVLLPNDRNNLHNLCRFQRLSLADNEDILGVQKSARQCSPCARKSRSSVGTLRGLVLSSVGRGFYTGNTERTATDFLGAGKEAGEIEFDARGLLFLDTDPCPIDGEAPARLHIAKHTFGAEGTTIGLRFRGALGTFSDDSMAALTDEQRAALDGTTSIKAVAAKIGRRETGTRAIVQGLVARGVVALPCNKRPLRVREEG